MVVTVSRQSAVEMAPAIKSYIKDREYDTKYPDLGDPKVRAAAVVNDEANFGKVFDRAFADNMADHIESTAGI